MVVKLQGRILQIIAGTAEYVHRYKKDGEAMKTLKSVPTITNDGIEAGKLTNYINKMEGIGTVQEPETIEVCRIIGMKIICDNPHAVEPRTTIKPREST